MYMLYMSVCVFNCFLIGTALSLLKLVYMAQL
jgi:hypothetical protein